MSGSLQAIRILLLNLIKKDEDKIKPNSAETVKLLEKLDTYVLAGAAHAGAFTGKAYISLADSLTKESLDEVTSIPMSNREIIYATRLAYREFALNLHQKFAEKAVNFKTDTFGITGMTERAKEIMRIVWWCDTEIKKLEEQITLLGTEDEFDPNARFGTGYVAEMNLIDHVLHF